MPLLNQLTYLARNNCALFRAIDKITEENTYLLPFVGPRYVCPMYILLLKRRKFIYVSDYCLPTLKRAEFIQINNNGYFPQIFFPRQTSAVQAVLHNFGVAIAAASPQFPIQLLSKLGAIFEIHKRPCYSFIEVRVLEKKLLSFKIEYIQKADCKKMDFLVNYTCDT